MYKHYLNFLDLPLIGKIEISEPFKFDGSTHEIKREKGRHSRDVIIANQDIELEFYREYFEPIEVPQVIPDGTILNYVSHGFDYLVNEINTKGWEMRVEYTIDYNGNEFTTGEIDGLTYKVFDDYLSIKISQNTLHAYIKKNDSVKIDAFSDKSLTGLPISPCTTTDVFLKAKPLLQKSSWNNGELNITSQSISTFIFPAPNLVKYEIEDSYIPFDRSIVYHGGSDALPIFDMRCLKAKNTLTNVKVSVNIKVTLDYITIGSNSSTGSSLSLFADFGDEAYLNNPTQPPAFGENIITINSSITSNTIDVVKSFTIEKIEQADFLSVYFIWRKSVNDTSTYRLNIQSCEMDIIATSTAVSTIVKGIRLYDLLRHQAHSYDTTLNDLGVFNNTSEYWNNFCFNGRMLGNLANQAFNNEFKNLYNSVCDEAFADYQIDNNGITIDFIDNYYKDEEIAVFTELPSNDANYTANSDYSINLFNLKFKKSSSDRTGNELSTNDDVHTSLQLKMPSKKADATFDIEFDHIRSAQLIEEQRRKGNTIDGKTRTLENDENLFVLDCIELAPNTTNNFTQFLRYRILDTTNALEIISNGTFVWTNLGMQVGQTIGISFTGLTTGTNFQITALEDFTIRLVFLNNFPTSDSYGETSITFDYILQGVLYTNRTNEGFTNIEGIANSDNYSNLRFTFKRILNKWRKVINTAGQYLIGKEANVTEIKINNELVTRMTGESADVIDFAPIEITEDRILNGKVHEIKVFFDFDKATELFTEIRDLKGYVRAIRNNNSVIRGFIKNARYTFRSQELLLTLEEKQDNLITEITDLEVIDFNIVNDFVNLYDANNLPLITPKEYKYFSIDGIIYNNLEDFTEKLLNLLT